MPALKNFPTCMLGETNNQFYLALGLGPQGHNYFLTVLTMSTGSTALDQSNFVWTSKFFSFYLELYKNKLKNLIQTSKFKYSFRWGFKYYVLLCYFFFY
jgi:hypothetical protein